MLVAKRSGSGCQDGLACSVRFRKSGSAGHLFVSIVINGAQQCTAEGRVGPRQLRGRARHMKKWENDHGGRRTGSAESQVTRVPGHALGSWQEKDGHVCLDKFAARKSDHVFAAHIADCVVLRARGVEMEKMRWPTRRQTHPRATACHSHASGSPHLHVLFRHHGANPRCGVRVGDDKDHVGKLFHGLDALLRV